jgi:hypothetical protein
MVVRKYCLITALALVTCSVHAMEETKHKKEKKQKKEKKEKQTLDTTNEQQPQDQFSDQLSELVAQYFEENHKRTEAPDTITRGGSEKKEVDHKSRFRNWFGKKQKEKMSKKNESDTKNPIEEISLEELQKATGVTLLEQDQIENLEETAEKTKGILGKIWEKIFGIQDPTVPKLLAKDYKSTDADILRMREALVEINETKFTTKKLKAVANKYFPKNNVVPVHVPSWRDPLSPKEKLRVLLISIPTVFLVLAIFMIKKKV